MSYESPLEKKALQAQTELSALHLSQGMSYGKCLMAFNLGWGRSPPPSRGKYSNFGKPDERLLKKEKATKVSMLKAKAQFLAQLTGLEVRTAKALPDEMLAKVADNQTVGAVFSVSVLEAALRKSSKI